MQGYIGIPLIFYLINPIVKCVSKITERKSNFTAFVTSLITICFLFSVEFATGVVSLHLLSQNNEVKRITLGKLATIWIFIGLISYAMLPRINYICPVYLERAQMILPGSGIRPS